METQEFKIPEEITTMIFSLLSARDAIRCSLVCRTWQKLITEQYFTQHAYSNVPYTAFFMITSESSLIDKVQEVVPVHDQKKNCVLSGAVDLLLSKKFKVLASNNGLLCLRGDEDLLVGNPVTSFWAEIPKLVLPLIIEPDGEAEGEPAEEAVEGEAAEGEPVEEAVEGEAAEGEPVEGEEENLVEEPERYRFAGATLLSFYPALSSDFHVLAPITLQPEDDNKIYTLLFNVFSSETWTWKLSSPITLKWDDNRPYDGRLNRYFATELRGGSVCWMQGNLLMGYKIDSDTYYGILLPNMPEKCIANKWILTGYDGGIYHLVVQDVKLTIWQLDANENWVREGEWRDDGFKRFVLVPFAIDTKRNMLFIKGRHSNELAAFHLANSRWEVVRQDTSVVSVFRVIPYAPSDAPFAGGIEGMNIKAFRKKVTLW